MRRILLLAALTLAVPGVLLGTGLGTADANSRHRIDAAYIARYHERHGHTQFRNGIGTPGHTWTAYQREARRLRIYLHRQRVARQRAALVGHWQGVADCEAGGNWHLNTGNGFYGGLQFSLSTWSNYGGQGMPDQQEAWKQATVAERVRTSSGLGAWPHCGSRYQ